MLDAEVLVSVKAEKETYIYKKSDYKIEIDTAMRVASLCKKMPHMGRIIKIDKENEYIYVRFEDGSVVKYEFDERENLALAYALTIHKSQGSEYPVVVIPIYDFIPMLTTRNLIYTGVTRAKKAILLIGSYKKMQLIIRNMNQNKRYSNLKDELNKLQKGEK